MYLQRLILTGFKNCASSDMSFSPKVNGFVGDNGAGKTNLLDAIYYLSFCKSYFNPQDMQNIIHGGEFFSIHGHYRRNGDQEDVVGCIQQRGQKKQFRLNKKEYDRLADHIGLFPLVMVSPSDADLINLGSEERRKYIDGVISQFDKVYLENLIVYNKALQQRNALLKSIAENRASASSLALWDRQRALPGKIIHEKRRGFLQEFIPLFRQFFTSVSGAREEVGITYESQLNGQEPEEMLAQSVGRDLAVRFTTTGIHKDDLSFMISGYPVKKFGSQGQQKSFLVALKLAQFEFTRRIKGFRPLLLFDDIFDKLDEHRVASLVRLVGEDNFGQVFISDTHPERILRIFKEADIDHRVFRIVSGNVTTF